MAARSVFLPVKSMGRGGWRTTVHGVAKGSHTTEHAHASTGILWAEAGARASKKGWDPSEKKLNWKWADGQKAFA